VRTPISERFARRALVWHPTGGKPRGRPEVVSDNAKGKVSKSSSSAAAPLAASGSFANLLAFTGATNATGCNGCEPPDTQLAVGRNEVVEAVNNDVLVFNRGGTQLASFPA
jgi:hypothetical protein